MAPLAVAQEEERLQIQDQSIAEELADGGDVNIASGAPATAAAAPAVVADLGDSSAQHAQPPGQPREDGGPPRYLSSATTPDAAQPRDDVEAGLRTPPNGSRCARMQAADVQSSICVMCCLSADHHCRRRS